MTHCMILIVWMNQNDAQGLIRTHTFSTTMIFHSTTAARTQVALIQCDNNIFRFYCKGGGPFISNRLTQLSVGFSLFEWHLYLYTFSTSGQEQSRCGDLTLLHNHFCIQMLIFYFEKKTNKKKPSIIAPVLMCTFCLSELPVSKLFESHRKFHFLQKLSKYSWVTTLTQSSTTFSEA